MRGMCRTRGLGACRRGAGFRAERAFESDFADVFLRSLDSEALFVEQALDELQGLQILRRVKTMLGVRVAGTQERELGLPETQHVGFDPERLGRLTDLEQLLGAGAGLSGRARGARTFALRRARCARGGSHTGKVMRRKLCRSFGAVGHEALEHLARFEG